MKKLVLVAAVSFILGTVLLSQGTGTPRQLTVKVDANGYLLTAAATQTPPITSTVFMNARLATDANGNLLIVCSGCGGGGGTPGGVNTQIQYNNAGAFGGADVTWNNGTDQLVINGATFFYDNGSIQTFPTVTNAQNSSLLTDVFVSISSTPSFVQAFETNIFSDVATATVIGFNTTITNSVDISSTVVGTIQNLIFTDTSAVNEVIAYNLNFDAQDTSAITHIFGDYRQYTKDAGASIEILYSYWANDILGLADTAGYYLWFDSGVGSDCDSGGVYRVNEYGIMAYYNPCFTKYTPAATNFERIIARWGDTGVFGADNVAYIGTEAGGTGTQRALALLGVPAVRANRTAAQSINNVTVTALAFNASDSYDYDTMHDTVTNNTRITINTAGVYLITSHAAFAADANNQRFTVFAINGTTTNEYSTQNATGGGLGTVIPNSMQQLFAVGDFIELQVWQSSGVALDVTGSMEAVRVAGN